MLDQTKVSRVPYKVLSSLHGESHEITITVSFERNDIKNVKMKLCQN